MVLTLSCIASHDVAQEDRHKSKKPKTDSPFVQTYERRKGGSIAEGKETIPKSNVVPVHATDQHQGHQSEVRVAAP